VQLELFSELCNKQVKFSDNFPFQSITINGEKEIFALDLKIKKQSASRWGNSL